MAECSAQDFIVTSPYPPKLWRVVHIQSQCRIGVASRDHVAADSTRDLGDLKDMKQAVKLHIDWGSRRPSCFLSAFGRKSHAIGWARSKRRNTGGGNVRIYQIDMKRLLDSKVCVLEAEALVAELHIHHPYAEDEFLIVGRIPGACIELEETIEEAEHNKIIALDDTPPRVLAALARLGLN